MDWSLRGCARHGHVTYAPEEEALAQRLQADTPAGTAWRCLRCESFVVGDPVGRGPADQAPIVLRGKALREATILRAFAVERWVRAVVLAAVAYGVLRFRHSETTLQETFNRVIPAARPLASALSIDLDHSWFVTKLQGYLHTNPRTLAILAAVLFGYAAIQLLEGVALWSLRRWGEYVASVSTSVFIPLEIYELTEKVSVLRVGAFVVNIALVVYLVVSKRLFGVRGGAAAYHAERAQSSVLEVEASALAST